MPTKPLLLVGAILAIRLASMGTSSAVASDLSAQCQLLEKAKYSDALNTIFSDLGIPTQINEAKVVVGEGSSAYCEVKGYVAPAVGFQIRLPLENWNGKLLKLGCGGLCGSTEHVKRCTEPLRRGYACLVSDGAHRGSGTEWMRNNTQAQIDFAYRSTHVATLAGKAILKWHYGDAPRKSYFMGCSGGGRQAMMEAQRFPWDFDGIIAGAPALATTGVLMTNLWNARAFAHDGMPILGPSEIEAIHGAVLQQCDLDDGIKDGVVGDPRACRFDPAKLLCREASKGACLTSSQLAAVEKIYGGPKTAAGEQIMPPSALPGSERTWLEIFPQLSLFLADQYGLLVHPGTGAASNVDEYDFERDFRRLGMAEALWEPVNPDLRRFKAAGGKLLMYTGWNDSIEGPLRDVDYYEAAERVIGSRGATQEFFRLFVIPGMNHCAGGDGAYAVDYLSYLEAWVEQGQAPDKLIGSHLKKLAPYRFPLDPKEVVFSRPIYPYPLRAEYLGRGDPKDAASFGPVNR